MWICAGIVVGDTPCMILEDDLCERLSCEPTVRVRRSDILCRWSDSCDLTVLITERDDDWHEMNVLGNFLPFVSCFFLDNSHPLLCVCQVSYIGIVCCRTDSFLNGFSGHLLLLFRVCLKLCDLCMNQYMYMRYRNTLYLGNRSEVFFVNSTDKCQSSKIQKLYLVHIISKV